jgi:hypothetical protein
MSVLQSIGRLIGFSRSAWKRRRALWIERDHRSTAGSSGEAMPPNGRKGPDQPAHADERTIRRVGEAQLGGMSSEASRQAYERGENPGGLHHGGSGPAPIHGDPESRR